MTKRSASQASPASAIIEGVCSQSPHGRHRPPRRHDPACANALDQRGSGLRARRRDPGRIPPGVAKVCGPAQAANSADTWPAKGVGRRHPELAGRFGRDLEIPLHDPPGPFRVSRPRGVGNRRTQTYRSALFRRSHAGLRRCPLSDAGSAPIPAKLDAKLSRHGFGQVRFSPRPEHALRPPKRTGRDCRAGGDEDHPCSVFRGQIFADDTSLSGARGSQWARTKRLEAAESMRSRSSLRATLRHAGRRRASAAQIEQGCLGKMCRQIAQGGPLKRQRTWRTGRGASPAVPARAKGVAKPCAHLRLPAG